MQFHNKRTTRSLRGDVLVAKQFGEERCLKVRIGPHLALLEDPGTQYASGSMVLCDQGLAKRAFGKNAQKLERADLHSLRPMRLSWW